MLLKDIKIIKRNGNLESFNKEKIRKALRNVCRASHSRYYTNYLEDILSIIESTSQDTNIRVDEIHDIIERYFMNKGQQEIARNYVIYRNDKNRTRAIVQNKKEFIKRYRISDNTANATVDDNSNIGNKSIGVLNNEIHKSDNIEVSRGMIMDKLRELYPDFDAKQYIRDLKDHIIYKHDESSFCGPIAPYCVSITMYPFLMSGLKSIGGLSARPQNLDSFCGIFPNLIFLISSQFAGAIATSEFFLYFDYFARKEWGDDYYLNLDKPSRSSFCHSNKNIQEQIHQYFQGVIYSINQPAGSRGLQSAFVNFSYFDREFFNGMFGNFCFPDGSKPIWESLNWLQRDFMCWFNNERLRCMLTFPVESFALVYKDGQFLDQDSADFVAEEYARGHSFFTYISDTVDSLSSCCRLKNMLTTREFNFTNGNMGIQTGSKSVITLNLNRIVQNWMRSQSNYTNSSTTERFNIYSSHKEQLRDNICDILERVYKYHTAYNEYLWDMYDAGLLPIYSAQFINLNKQYLTIGLNGLNQAAEFLGIECRDNKEYSEFCQFLFSTLKEQNLKHGGEFNGHKLTFNTEQVPAESLAIKNYNWDKSDEYWVPEDTNLYASYIFKPNDPDISILEKIRLHGRNYIGEYLDGGAAAHLNLEEHLSIQQYKYILKYAAEQGCNYLTFNVPNSCCENCGFITKHPIEKCPRCGSKNITYYDRVIGYLTKIRNWSEGRQIEQRSRVYENISNSAYKLDSDL